ncbi:MAG: BsuPI-related putative proteinase inhibitor [Lawsonibacter sp.]|nr:BsuPI-related putative proteinase inhibitor [Lawsonibacter sp.]
MKRIPFRVLVVVVLLLTTVPLTVQARSDTGSAYSDISGTWFADAATQYGSPEIFSDGTSEFHPDREITRIEFVRLLHKALAVNINYFVAPDIKDNFDDMENGDVGANELIDLATIGIIESGGGFRPGDSLTREEMVHWVINALNNKTGGVYSIPQVKPVPFGDDLDISDAYRDEIYSAAVLGLVSGRGNYLLFPKATATRAEAVTVVSRLMMRLDSDQSSVAVTAAAQLDGDGALAMSLTIRNHTDQMVVIHHTSGQKYDFRLFDAQGNNVYTWSRDKMFMALMSETEIGPGEELVFSDTLSSEAYEAVKQAVSMRATIVGTSDNFSIDPDGYTAVIVK